MTDTGWRGVEQLGTVRAGDLLSALKKVESARHPRKDSSLSGVMLHVADGALTIWATDQILLSTTPVTFEARSEVARGTAVVPGGWGAALRGAFGRSDILELGLRKSMTLLARRIGAQESLAQPLWPDQTQLDACREMSTVQESAGIIGMRGKDLAAVLRGAPDGAPLIIALESEQITVLSGADVLGTVPVVASLPPCRMVVPSTALSAAVDAVTNLKLPTAILEMVSEERLKLYGASRTEPVQYSALDCFILTGASAGPGSQPEDTAHPEPGDAVVEQPGRAAPTDTVLDELDGIIGQPSLKKQVKALRTQVGINLKREEQGLKASQVGAHMVFAGPPGTGKTTVARLIAKLYHSLGVLEHEEVVEVSRTEIVSENIGGTEKNMREAIENAQGGVLFVDEAYAFAAEQGSNDFGPKAIEALLKAVEDNRNSFVCILAGYTDRMKYFMAANPGLRSRCPRTISFEAYTPEELTQIALSMARGSDNDLDPDGVAELSRRLADEQGRGGFAKEDWGNARSVRNIVEQAAVHRDVRISLSGASDRESLMTITAPDVADACDDVRIGRAVGRTESAEDVLAELDAQVGQPQMKHQVRAIIAQAKVRSAKQEHGLADSVDLEHLLFVGPPGTGKTTIARLIARLHRALGILPNEEIVEVTQEVLVAGYKGQTAIRTREKIDEAMGGVLFIDEAYALVSSGDSGFGQEAIDTLLPALENSRGSFVAIAAGYPDEMAKFVASNVGLASRFTTTIEFLSYTADELVQIAQIMATAKAETLTDGAVRVLRQRLRAMELNGRFTAKDWGNARSVRTLLMRAVQLRDLRLSDADLSSLDATSLVTVTEADMIAACDREHFAADTARESVEEALAELDSQVGQQQVKQQVRALVAQAELAARRKEAGLAVGPVPLEHLLFVGPPGTGKTTVARLIGRLYRALGLLPKGELVEVDRSGLVAEYVGQTSPRTNAKVDEAMGGILFIDEAYALVPTGSHDFGGEAITALVPRLEEDKNKFVVIAAGYPEEMRRFVNHNVGLASRFTTTIEFLSYGAQELARIAEVMARRGGQQLRDDASELLADRLEAAEQSGRFTDKHWGNAREMRNLLDEAMKHRDLRLHSDGYGDPAEMVLLEAADVARACDKVIGT